MIIQHSNVLLEIITKIEVLIAEQKAKSPGLSDEEIIELIKNNFRRENKY